MYRVFVGLMVLITIELWSGVTTVHGEKLDIVVTAALDPGDTEPPIRGTFTVINNTTDYLVKAFAVTLGNAVSATTERSMWEAEASVGNPIPGLPGSGGAGDILEYVHYYSTGGLLTGNFVEGTVGARDNSFAFRISQALLTPSAVGIIAVKRDGSEVVTCIGSPGTPCQVLPDLTSPLTALGPATILVGLKNSDDQGAKFDLRAEVYIIDVAANGDEIPVSEGMTRCIAGVTRNPNNPTEVSIDFDEILHRTFHGGDRLFLRISTRIGTNADKAETKCSGPGGSHNNARGLRLYYDAARWRSRFGIAATPEPPLAQDFFLHSYAGDFFDDLEPTAAVPQYRDSPSLNFAGGNRWQTIGTWSMPLPGRTYTARD